MLCCVIKLFYSYSCKCVCCCERETELSPKSWKKSRGFVQIHMYTLQIMAKTRSDFDNKIENIFPTNKKSLQSRRCCEDRSSGSGGEILRLE